VTRQLRGFEPPRLTRVLLTSQAELESYFRHESPGSVTHLPRVAWSRREAVVIAAGPRSSTGYVLRVLGVRETPNTITVTVHEVTPRLGQTVQARLTYPYRMITIPRVRKKLFVHWPGRP
jgi:hypothetical protein